MVDTNEAMNKFIVDYKIPPNVSLEHCKMGEWHIVPKNTLLRKPFPHDFNRIRLTQQRRSEKKDTNPKTSRDAN